MGVCFDASLLSPKLQVVGGGSSGACLEAGRDEDYFENRIE